MKKEKEVYKKVSKEFDNLINSESNQNTDENWLHITCPNCSTLISSENLELDEKIGKCDTCHAIFSIEEGIKKIKANENNTNLQWLDGIHEEDSGFGKELWCKLTPSSSIKANGFAYFFLALIFLFVSFGMFHDGNLAAVFMTSIVTLFFLVVGFDHVKRFRRPVHIQMDEYNLKINYPYLKKKYKIDFEQVDSVAVKSHGTSYALWLTQKNGQQTALFKNLKNEKQANYVAHRINQYINLN